MYGYVKTMRLCLIEYLLSLLLHIGYAFLVFDIETGCKVTVVSAIMLLLTVFVALIIKNEKVVVTFTYISVVISTTIIGYLLNTLTFSVFVFLVMSVIMAIFMEAAYIIYSAVISVVAFIVYLIAFPDKILMNLDSPLIFIVYIAMFIFGMVNLFVVVFYGKKYLVGMKEKAEDAQNANESKMLFLTNMSHEIRTPMNAICGLAELTLRTPELPDEAKENVESIQTAGRVLISIVNDILDYSKLESGKMEIIPVTYSFSFLIKDVLNMMTVRMEDKDIDIRADIQEGLPDILIGDEIRIRQILFNLLSNAVKFTEKGYVILDIKGIEDSGFLDLTISVTDSGIGIKKEDLSKIFTSFNQVDTRKTKNRVGTGLGLAICKELLEFMGGSIEVESSYGVGSKFTVHFSQKISTDNNAKIVTHIEDNSDARVNAPDAKVLIVDDNSVNLKVAQGLVRTFGIQVDTCTSGRACLELLRENKDYDIIFLDHMMPELDGIDTLNLIRADGNDYMKNVPIIALTANVVSGVRDMFISAGFNDYVPKPIDIVWLNGILRKYLPLEKQR